MFFSKVARNITLVFITALLFVEPIYEYENIVEVQNQNSVEVYNKEIVQVEESLETIPEEQSNNSSEWEIEIPKINLRAEITEGTTAEVMNKFIGHFEETPKVKGNIGLAAHNRGYPVNYFKDLKLLEIGDKIHYKYNNEMNRYIVDKIKVIKDTNWEMLKNTEENRLTLITCIENEPEYRLCVQAIEVGG